ncbi:hypothetical protein BK010_09990 [Tenericutes bacterium MO-XQ]|nr:hypothetical protein BK010_09990 [Tenericutes bacterium MO-XQ]
MKKLNEDQKMIKQLKNMNKVSVFMPIFYTFFYGLALVGAIILPEEIIKQKWIIIVILVLFLTLTWTIFTVEKKHEKEAKEEIDELIYKIENDIEDEDHLSDEHFENIKKRVLSISRDFIITVVASAALSLIIVFKDFLNMNQTLWVITLGVLGILATSFFVVSLIKYMKLKSYI